MALAKTIKVKGKVFKLEGQYDSSKKWGFTRHDVDNLAGNYQLTGYDTHVVKERGLGGPYGIYVRKVRTKYGKAV